MTTYLVCFDISDDRARVRAGNYLLRYGDRVQESVFEIQLSNTSQLEAVVEELQEMTGDVNLRFYRLCVDCRRQSRTLQGDAVTVFPANIVV